MCFIILFILLDIHAVSLGHGVVFVYKGGFQFHLRMLLLQSLDQRLGLITPQHETHGRKSVTEA